MLRKCCVIVNLRRNCATKVLRGTVSGVVLHKLRNKFCLHLILWPMKDFYLNFLRDEASLFSMQNNKPLKTPLLALNWDNRSIDFSCVSNFENFEAIGSQYQLDDLKLGRRRLGAQMKTKKFDSKTKYRLFSKIKFLATKYCCFYVVLMYYSFGPPFSLMSSLHMKHEKLNSGWKRKRNRRQCARNHFQFRSTKRHKSCFASSFQSRVCIPCWSILFK